MLRVSPPRVGVAIVGINTQRHTCNVSHIPPAQIFSPGLRVGWIQTTQRSVRLLGRSALLMSGGCPCQLSSRIVTVALGGDDVDAWLGTLQRRYAARCAALWETLRDNIPDGCRLTRPWGGYFLWLGLPPGVRADAVQALVKDKVKFAHGAKSRADGVDGPIGGGGGKDEREWVRLCFARLPIDKLRAGAVAFAEALNDVRA